MRTNCFKRKALLACLPIIAVAIGGEIFAQVEGPDRPKKDELPELPEGIIKSLGHEDFKKRHAGQRELLMWGKEDPVSYTHLTLPTILRV